MSSTLKSSATGDGGRQYVGFEEYIEYQLRIARKGIHSADLLTGLVGAVLLLCGYLLVFAVTDHWLIHGGWGQAARYAWWLVFVAGLGYWGWKKIYSPWSQRVTQLYAASQLEHVHPELKSNLLTLVDLQQAGRPVSPAILEAIERRAATNLQQVNVDDAVDRRTLTHLSYALLGLVVVLCIYMLASPKSLMSSAWRALLPMANVAPGTRTTILEVLPGDATVLSHAKPDITAVLSGTIPPEVRVVYSTADRKVVNEVVKLQDTDEGIHRYRGRLIGEGGQGLMQNLTYRIEAGDAVSPTYSITVKQPPTATVSEIIYDYPAYMGIDDRTQADSAIDAWEGTTVTIKAQANVPIDSAIIKFSDTEDTTLKAEEFPMRIEDGVHLSFPWMLKFRPDGTFPRFYRIEPVKGNERGTGLTLHTVRIRPDLPPKIDILYPQGDIELPANTALPVAYEANDPDFQLKSVVMKFEKDGEPLPRQAVLFESPPVAPKTKGKHSIALKDFGVEAGQKLVFWLEAKDNFEPFADRVSNLARSPKITITVTDPVESKQAEKQQEQQEKAADEKLDQSEPMQNPADGQPQEPAPENPEEQPMPDQPPPEKGAEPEAQPEQPKGDQPMNPEQGQPDQGQDGQPKPDQPQDAPPNKDDETAQPQGKNQQGSKAQNSSGQGKNGRDQKPGKQGNSESENPTEGSSTESAPSQPGQAQPQSKPGMKNTGNSQGQTQSTPQQDQSNEGDDSSNDTDSSPQSSNHNSRKPTPSSTKNSPGKSGSQGSQKPQEKAAPDDLLKRILERKSPPQDGQGEKQPQNPEQHNKPEQNAKPGTSDSPSGEKQPKSDKGSSPSENDGSETSNTSKPMEPGDNEPGDKTESGNDTQSGHSERPMKNPMTGDGKGQPGNSSPDRNPDKKTSPDTKPKDDGSGDPDGSSHNRTMPPSGDKSPMGGPDTNKGSASGSGKKSDPDMPMPGANPTGNDPKPGEENSGENPPGSKNPDSGKSGDKPENTPGKPNGQSSKTNPSGKSEPQDPTGDRGPGDSGSQPMPSDDPSKADPAGEKNPQGPPSEKPKAGTEEPGKKTGQGADQPAGNKPSENDPMPADGQPDAQPGQESGEMPGSKKTGEKTSQKRDPKNPNGDAGTAGDSDDQQQPSKNQKITPKDGSGKQSSEKPSTEPDQGMPDEKQPSDGTGGKSSPQKPMNDSASEKTDGGKTGNPSKNSPKNDPSGQKNSAPKNADGTPSQPGQKTGDTEKTNDSDMAGTGSQSGDKGTPDGKPGSEANSPEGSESPSDAQSGSKGAQSDKGASKSNGGKPAGSKNGGQGDQPGAGKSDQPGTESSDGSDSGQPSDSGTTEQGPSNNEAGKQNPASKPMKGQQPGNAQEPGMEPMPGDSPSDNTGDSNSGKGAGAKPESPAGSPMETTDMGQEPMNGEAGKQPSGQSGKNPSGDQQSPNGGEQSQKGQSGGKQAGQQNGQQAGGQPGGQQAGQGNTPAGQAGNSSQSGGGTATGRGPDNDDRPPSNPGTSAPSQEQIDSENLKKSIGLQIEQLQKELSRGEIPDDLKDTNYSVEELEAFLRQLYQQLHAGEAATPEAQARQRQFEELLKSVDSVEQGHLKAGATGEQQASQSTGGGVHRTPKRLQSAEEAFRRRMQKAP